MERLLTGEVEVRGGRALAGIALPWETRAEKLNERFERDSIELAAAGVCFNIGHDVEKVIAWTGAGLSVESRAAGLHIEAQLAQANPVAMRAMRMVKRGVRGLSIEFRAVRERREDDGQRVIQSAILSGVALHGQPIYRTSVELRGKRWARSRVMPNNIRSCSCVGGDCDSVDFGEGAFDNTIKLVADGERDLVAHTGGFSPDKVLASAGAGTLAVSIGEAGELVAEIDEKAANTPAGRMLAESNDATAPVLRPLIDDSRSEFRDEGNVRVYSSAWISSLLLKVAQDADGWERIEIGGREPDRRGHDDDGSHLLWI
ncbi:MAG: HK97 family phage prohead protease [Gammaproteobacteria bacterium]|nr:HK97 family phage prohead protease [Gammaproteobacteria bacterium]